MSQYRKVSFSSPAARLQYFILMGLFRVAVTRGLYGRFARGLTQIFGSDNAAFLQEGAAPPFKIHLSDGYWTRFALYHRNYEPEVGQILQAASGATALFCDLGANKGYWTLRAASLFPHILSVEASQITFALLAENVQGLSNVTLRRAAIHNRSGDVLNFINTHLSHASARLGLVETAGAGDTSETVETLRIDDLVPAGTPALIKLDVEGAEVAAFQGAARAIKEGAVVIYEDHGSDNACAPSAYLLSQPDISVYFCENGLTELKSIAAIRRLKTDRFKGYNLIGAHTNSPLLTHIREAFAN